MATKKVTEIPTIDVVLVTIKETGSTDEYALDTASKIAVTPQTEVTDAVKLVIKGVLKAQKPQVTTITGNTIVLTNNVFTPELVKILQGGTIAYDSGDPTKIIGYTPPVVGEASEVPVFTTCAYSAQYDESGSIVQYEKIEYPNCRGIPVAFGYSLLS